MRHRLAVTAAAAVLLPTLAVAGTAPASAAPGGNNGTIKLSEVGGPENPSNDPKLPCTFEIQWYGFDAGKTLYSDVRFEGWGADKDVVITVAAGSTRVFIGEDAAGGAKDHDATEVYTLAFDRPAHNAKHGYHVKVLTENDGSRGNDGKSKVIYVEPCAAGPTTPTSPTDPTTPPVPTDPTTPTTPTDPTTPPVPSDPTDPVPTDPTEPTTPPDPTDPTTPPVPTTPTTPAPTEPVTSDPTYPTPPVVPWTWDWTYAPPSCDALTVDYPANLPSGQANDVNIRFATAGGEFTLNFHHDGGTWAGRTVFSYAAHPRWPAGLTAYSVVWVQVGGTNYHWQGDVPCGPGAPVVPVTPTPPATPAPQPVVPEAPQPPVSAPAQVRGFATGTVSVPRGTALSAVRVEVVNTDASVLQVQQFQRGGWRKQRTVRISHAGTAKVTFPKLRKRGTYKFRIVVAGTASKPLTIRVR